jgi:subtilisin family serine protease
VRRLTLAVAVAALALPAAATAAGYAVGIRPDTSLNSVAARLHATTGGHVTLDRDLRVAYVSRSRGLARVRGVAYVERLSARRPAFVPNDPLVLRQWYLNQVHAFDFWQQLPPLAPVKVAVVDSGIDGSHPDLQPKLLAAKSFVKGRATHDSEGHGTFVAGEIAAATNNGIGIAGVGLPVQLLVAKVVRRDGTIPLRAEASAIRWAVKQGARVINLSLAGLRDPLAHRRDTFSPLEAAAIRFAISKHAVVVAAVGNSDQAPRTPWNFAGYPAALPHVLGVSALEPSGDVPEFSNRDAYFNDISAPGVGILSTIPLAMSGSACADRGYSDCGPFEFRRGEGTSFAAPLVSGAAALVLGVRPGLMPDQVAWLLEQTADDINPSTGCRACPPDHDRLSGAGRVDVTAAVAIATTGAYIRPDSREPNDDAGTLASKVLTRRRGTINATVDFWNDPVDVYRIRLRKNQRLSLFLNGPQGVNANLSLWKPGTKTVQDLSPTAQRMRVAQSHRAGSNERIAGYRARFEGWYYVEVRLASKSAGAYQLTVTRSSTA